MCGTWEFLNPTKSRFVHVAGLRHCEKSTTLYASARPRIITGEMSEYCQQNSGSAADTKTLMVARPFYLFCWDFWKQKNSRYPSLPVISIMSVIANWNFGITFVEKKFALKHTISPHTSKQFVNVDNATLHNNVMACQRHSQHQQLWKFLSSRNRIPMTNVPKKTVIVMTLLRAGLDYFYG